MPDRSQTRLPPESASTLYLLDSTLGKIAAVGRDLARRDGVPYSVVEDNIFALFDSYLAGAHAAARRSLSVHVQTARMGGLVFTNN